LKNPASKSEKLAAAGCLAAALAHEINNPLQVVANLVSIWRQSPGVDTQGQECAALAEGELRRVRHLTQQLLTFYPESGFPCGSQPGRDHRQYSGHLLQANRN
jgi:two-component system CheB/CheR fusion protein